MDNGVGTGSSPAEKGGGIKSAWQPATALVMRAGLRQAVLKRRKREGIGAGLSENTGTK